MSAVPRGDEEAMKGTEKQRPFNETQYDDKDWSMDPSNVNQGKQWN